MELHIEVVDEIPSERPVVARKSQSSTIVQAAREAPTHKIAVTASSKEELERLYKALVQWKSRRNDPTVQVMKRRDTIYVWIDE